MKDNVLLNFDDLTEDNQSQKPPSKNIKPVQESKFDDYLNISVDPKLNPYQHAHCPPDIYEYLLADGSTFGLFSDPYASMKYVDVHVGNRNGRYWLEERLEDHSFTDRELKLLEFLSNHRVATRHQIHRVVTPETENKNTVLKFIRQCRKRGIICAFTWVSPLDTEDSPKKPLVYGLTRVGAEAAETLFHKQLSDDFWFHPIKFPRGSGPNMTTFNLDLVANELYSELVRIDRLISWERRPQVRLNDGTFHYPGATFEVIKDLGEIRLFWLEIVRVGKDWVSRTINRFKRTQHAIDQLSPYQRPARVIIITDGDARIPMLAKMAEDFMPDVKVRFTHDERLLDGLNKNTFITWNKEKKNMQLSPIPFLQEGYEGMTASEYFEQQERLYVEDEDDLDYDE